MAGRLAGKIAIVTGAGRGIGEAIARCFAGEGAAVTIAEKDPETGAATARSIVENGGRAHFVATDVTDAEASTRRRRDGGQVRPADLLVNNAGTNVFHEPLAMSDEEWRALLSPRPRCRLDLQQGRAAGMLAAGGGSIVNIASTPYLHRSSATRFPYPVAKHALLGLTRALGIEYAGRGIRVNAIAPGYIETPIATDYWNTFPDPGAERQRAYDLHPPKRIGRPEEVAMDRRVPGLRRGALHQCRLHRHRWGPFGALPRLTGGGDGRVPCLLLQGICSHCRLPSG